MNFKVPSIYKLLKRNESYLETFMAAGNCGEVKRQIGVNF